jgi:hypothetical protein
MDSLCWTLRGDPCRHDKESMPMKKYLIGVAMAAALGSSAYATPANMHGVFVALGMTMQDNLACHNGGPIHLDDYPLDPDIAEFRAEHHALAHQWAMEGVNAEMGHSRCY